VIRQPAVAGSFYPGNPAQLQQAVQHYLAEGRQSTLIPKAIIAPHAGYIYSGPIAGSAYRSLQPRRQQIRRVVLLGPSHHVAFHGLAAPTSTAFRTPLGDIPVDQAAIAGIADLPQLSLQDQPHLREHSLEVQLPFLQEAVGSFSLIPLVVGMAVSAAIAEVLERLWGGEETVIVISSDLSHYLPYDGAQQLDLASSRAIEALDDTALGHDSACGRLPINGLLHLARRRGLREETVDLRNSGDTAGDRRRVVGYGAYLFAEPTTESHP
jgi:AmmeMemoRadiSam system protein B